MEYNVALGKNVGEVCFCLYPQLVDGIKVRAFCFKKYVSNGMEILILGIMILGYIFMISGYILYHTIKLPADHVLASLENKVFYVLICRVGGI